ncbi:energy transducer TonB [Flavobacterium dauae]|uniref:energy transducer TonB n=1 Tax=Flavobacterium dauae TaxID=1563479 RepID=UPI00101B3C3E|nr:energy transducer TonB [Flavobacterium dauae]WLD23550.1 energy transducer TonB [Flavobacterium dauae]
MKLIVVLFITGFSWAGFSQNIPPTTVEKSVSEAPAGNSVNDSIINGNPSDYIALTGQSIQRFVGENYNFPDEALQNEISGTVYVQFIVEKDGSVSNVIIEQGLCNECDLEAIRVVKKLRLKPVFINEQPERIRFRIPIRLALE